MRGVRGDEIARVLVVDGDAMSRRVLQQVLLGGGLLVDLAADGQEALQKIRERRPDVVVTDWTMPHVDGLTLCRFLKESDETRYTHVIILSARGEAEAKVTGPDTGADDYLVKPVEPVELQARVRVGLRLQRALSELAVRNELLERLALTDPLTGLANRRAFEETLASEMARVLRHGRPISLLVLGLDRYEPVDDAHGHPAGDDVLAGLADLIRLRGRRGDVTARIGGEEFAMLLPQTTGAQAVLVAERIRRSVERTSLGLRPPAAVTVSIGLATFQGGAGPDPAPFLGEADSALHRAREGGRNRVAVSEAGPPAPGPPPGPGRDRE